MKKIVITGAGGFLGSRLAARYKDKYNVVALRKDQLNIVDKEKTLSCIKEINPDIIIHTGAIADTLTCEKNPMLSHDINVKGSCHVAEAAKETKSKLIFCSTEQIFNGNVERGPYLEASIPNPNTMYGRHKLEAEKAICERLEDSIIIRLTWLFGLPERKMKVNSNIVWNVVQSAITGNRITIPKNEFRGMTYVEDLLENFEKLFELPKGVYHTGSENELNTYETACVVLKSMGLERRIGEIIVSDEEKYRDVPRDIRISNKKLASFGIHFEDTEQGIKRCLQEFGYGNFL